MSAMLFNEFVVAATAEEAVERLALLHRQAREALGQALRRYLKERAVPSTLEREQFRYPELRLTYHCHGEVPQTTRAYARCNCRVPTASP